MGAVIGAVLGGSIAHDISSREAHATPVRRVRQEVCEVVDKKTFRERVTGYLVTYRYDGETHRARMAREPRRDHPRTHQSLARVGASDASDPVNPVAVDAEEAVR